MAREIPSINGLAAKHVRHWVCTKVVFGRFVFLRNYLLGKEAEERRNERGGGGARGNGGDYCHTWQYETLKLKRKEINLHRVAAMIQAQYHFFFLTFSPVNYMPGNFFFFFFRLNTCEKCHGDLPIEYHI